MTIHKLILIPKYFYIYIILEPLRNKRCFILCYYTNTKSNTSLAVSPNHPHSRYPPTRSYVSGIGYSDQAHVHTEQCIICKSLRSCRNQNKNETYTHLYLLILILPHKYTRENIKSVSAVGIDQFIFEIKIIYYEIRVKYFYRFGLAFRIQCMHFNITPYYNS